MRKETNEFRRMLVENIRGTEREVREIATTSREVHKRKKVTSLKVRSQERKRGKDGGNSVRLWGVKWLRDTEIGKILMIRCFYRQIFSIGSLEKCIQCNSHL